jgi:hypothetical protein
MLTGKRTVVSAIQPAPKAREKERNKKFSSTKKNSGNPKGKRRKKPHRPQKARGTERHDTAPALPSLHREDNNP